MSHVVAMAFGGECGALYPFSTTASRRSNLLPPSLPLYPRALTPSTLWAPLPWGICLIRNWGEGNYPAARNSRGAAALRPQRVEVGPDPAPRPAVARALR